MSAVLAEMLLWLQNWHLSQQEEPLKAFLEKVQADTSPQGKLKAAADAAVAKNGQFVISSDGISLSYLFH